MLCPYCLSPLKPTPTRTKSGEPATVHECFSCGGHWFPRWLANDISSSEAHNLDSIRLEEKLSPPASPRCPECQTRLSLIRHDSIPQGIKVWSCPQGHGNFFPHGELIQFKKAQEAKITYHQLWGVPIKSIFAVLLPVLVVLAVAAGIPLTLEQIQKRQETRTLASPLVATPAITQIPPNSAVISFTTHSPVTSRLTLYQNQTVIETLDVSLSPTTRHFITLTRLTPATGYTYTLTLTDPITQSPFTSDSFSLTTP